MPKMGKCCCTPCFNSRYTVSHSVTLHAGGFSALDWSPYVFGQENPIAVGWDLYGRVTKNHPTSGQHKIYKRFRFSFSGDLVIGDPRLNNHGPYTTNEEIWEFDTRVGELMRYEKHYYTGSPDMWVRDPNTWLWTFTNHTGVNRLIFPNATSLGFSVNHDNASFSGGIPNQYSHQRITLEEPVDPSDLEAEAHALLGNVDIAQTDIGITCTDPSNFSTFTRNTRLEKDFAFRDQIWWYKMFQTRYVKSPTGVRTIVSYNDGDPTGIIGVFGPQVVASNIPGTSGPYFPFVGEQGNYFVDPNNPNPQYPFLGYDTSGREVRMNREIPVPQSGGTWGYFDFSTSKSKFTQGDPHWCKYQSAITYNLLEHKPAGGASQPRSITPNWPQLTEWVGPKIITDYAAPDDWYQGPVFSNAAFIPDQWPQEDPLAPATNAYKTSGKPLECHPTGSGYGDTGGGYVCDDSRNHPCSSYPSSLNLGDPNSTLAAKCTGPVWYFDGNRAEVPRFGSVQAVSQTQCGYYLVTINTSAKIPGTPGIPVVPGTNTAGCRCP